MWKSLSENTTTTLSRFNSPEIGAPLGTGYMASTPFNGMRYDPDLVELKLIHLNKDPFTASYNKT